MATVPVIVSLFSIFDDRKKMKKYVHEFVENYDGFLGFGWDRKTDEDSVICYLQMFSDDRLIRTLVQRMSDAELEELHHLVNRLLITHLNDSEYHGLFLREAHDHNGDEC